MDVVRLTSPIDFHLNYVDQLAAIFFHHIPLHVVNFAPDFPLIHLVELTRFYVHLPVEPRFSSSYFEASSVPLLPNGRLRSLPYAPVKELETLLAACRKAGRGLLESDAVTRGESVLTGHMATKGTKPIRDNMPRSGRSAKESAIA